MKFLDEIGFSYFANRLKTMLGKKVDKVQGKGLSTEDYKTEEKEKLASVETGANKYTHPTKHPASIITETTTKRFVSDSEKDTWNAKETVNGAKSKADTALSDAKVYVDGKVKTDVPTGAKFTDTIYDDTHTILRGYDSTEQVEDLTGSIDADTLGGRPASYYLDTTHLSNKSNPHSVTKSQVGLSNVDNIQQATKTEFNSHKGDSTHITTAERSVWNSKETTSGARTKATQALNDAKTYVNNKVKTDVPLNAKFTDTTYTAGSNINISSGKISVTGQLGLTENEVKQVKVDNAVNADRLGGKTADEIMPENLTLTSLTLGNYKIVYNATEDTLDFEVVQ